MKQIAKFAVVPGCAVLVLWVVVGYLLRPSPNPAPGTQSAPARYLEMGWQGLAHKGDPSEWQAIVRICRDVDHLRSVALTLTDADLQKRKIALEENFFGKGPSGAEILKKYLSPQQ